MSRRTKVYIAGPLHGHGDVPANVHKAVEAADELLESGYAPFCPHLTHFWGIIVAQNKSWDTWLSYDEEWLRVCDCLLRLEGLSSGADREKDLAVQLGLPVFSDIEILVESMPPVIEQ